MAGAQAVSLVNTVSTEGEACNYSRQETALTKLHVFQIPTSQFNNIARNYTALQRVMSRAHSICAVGIFTASPAAPKVSPVLGLLWPPCRPNESGEQTKEQNVCHGAPPKQVP